MPNINKIHCGLDIKIHFVQNRLHHTEAYHRGGGRQVLLIMGYREALPESGTFFGTKRVGISPARV